MHRMNISALMVTIALGVLTGVAGQASAQGVTAYEGARVIVGDGRVLDNTTLVVSDTKITQVGGAVPADSDQRFNSDLSFLSSSSNDMAPLDISPLMKKVGVASTFSCSKANF